MTDDKVKSKSIDDETKFYEKIANTPLPDEEQGWYDETYTFHEIKENSELEISELSSEYKKLHENINSFEKKIHNLFGEDFKNCVIAFTSNAVVIHLDNLHYDSISLLNTLTTDWELTSSELDNHNLKITWRR